MVSFIALLFLLGLPLVVPGILWFADMLLMKRIPQLDTSTIKTRTDIYSMRAAYASFIVGLAVLTLWAIGVVALGIIAALRLL